MRRAFPLITLLLCASLGAIAVYASDSYTALLNIPISITGPDGVCKKVTNASAMGLSEYIPTTSVGEWQSFAAHPPAGVTLSSCSITISSGTNVNLCTLAGNPTTAGSYTFTIDVGTVVGSNSTAQPALTTGSCWVAGTTLTLINNGYIEGMGGAGGNGYPNNSAGSPGLSGGTAFAVSYAVRVDNRGSILGGGGGGGGSGAFKTGGLAGAGGGGGQSYASSAGGTGYVGGGPGSQSGPGAGGNSGNSLVVGGNGGAWGSVGSAGTAGVPSAGVYPGAGAGGAAGAAITGSGYGITWITYGDVRGPVQ